MLVLYILVHVHIQLPHTDLTSDSRHYIMLDNISYSTSWVSTKIQFYSSLAAAFTFKWHLCVTSPPKGFPARLHILTVPSLAFIVCLRLRLTSEESDSSADFARYLGPTIYLIYGGKYMMINWSGADDETSCPNRKELHVVTDTWSPSSGPIYIKVGYHQAACTRTRNPLRCNNTFLLY